MLRIFLGAVLLTSLATTASAQRGPGKRVKTTKTKPVAKRATRHRAHLSSPALLKRLDVKVQQNASVTFPIVVAKRGENNQVGLGHGTGFLVTRPDAKGRAIIMTNHHVVESSVGQFAAMQIGGASVQGQTRVIVTSAKLDYALLEVTVPAKANLRPVTLARTPRSGKDSIYSVGFPSVNLLAPQNVAGRASKWANAVAKGAPKEGMDPFAAAAGALAHSPQVISLGRESSATVAKASIEKNTEYYSAPGAPGASGSPVFSRGSHKVVGILYGASPSKDGKSMVTAVTPMSLILKDAAKQMKSLASPEQAQVKRLIEAAQ